MAQNKFYIGYISNNYAMMGVDSWFKWLGIGGTKKWDQATQTVRYVFKGVEIKITAGSNIAEVGGKKVTLAQPASVTNNTMFVPVASLMREIGQATGETFGFKYDAKTQQMTMDSSYDGFNKDYSPYNIPAKPGQVRVLDPNTGKWKYADPKDIGKFAPPPMSVDEVENNEQIRDTIMRDGPEMKRRAAKFGIELTDAMIETIERGGPDAVDLIHQMDEVMRLEPFADINKQLFGGSVTIDQARELESKWINPGRMQSGVMAEEFVKAHPEILEDIKIFGGKDFTQQEAISWRMGENESFGAAFEQAQKSRAAAFKPTETNAPISWEEGELKLKGKRQSWV